MDHGDILFDESDVDLLNPDAVAEVRDRAREEAVELTERELGILRERVNAYRAVFTPGTAPTEKDVELVMADLARFCRANRSTFKANEREHALLEGRREVFLRVMDFTKLEFDPLALKYIGKR